MNGVSPREVGMMSLWELFSTFAGLPEKTDRAMTPDEMEAAKDRWRALKLPDVKL